MKSLLGIFVVGMVGALVGNEATADLIEYTNVNYVTRSSENPFVLRVGSTVESKLEQILTSKGPAQPSNASSPFAEGSDRQTFSKGRSLARIQPNNRVYQDSNIDRPNAYKGLLRPIVRSVEGPISESLTDLLAFEALEDSGKGTAIGAASKGKPNKRTDRRSLFSIEGLISDPALGIPVLTLCLGVLIYTIRNARLKAQDSMKG